MAPHCLNVFVPLVALTRDNGPTEFVPRSHSSWEAAQPSVVPTLAAGGYLVFDYRLRHRGLGNRSGEARPLLYLTYAKPFFADVTNFNAKRYPTLPEVRRAAPWVCTGAACVRALPCARAIVALAPEADPVTATHNRACPLGFGPDRISALRLAD